MSPFKKNLTVYARSYLQIAKRISAVKKETNKLNKE